MPKKAKNDKKAEEAKKPDPEPEPEPEPEPPEPTEEEKQKAIELKLQDPQNVNDVVLDFELESSSEKMLKYITNKKQQYVDAHNKFKENEIVINVEYNNKLSIAINNIRDQNETSDKK